MSYIFWKLLFQLLILATNKPFLSIPREVRILLTQWAHVNSILHCVLGWRLYPFSFLSKLLFRVLFWESCSKKNKFGFFEHFFEQIYPIWAIYPFFEHFSEHFFEQYSTKVLFWALFWVLKKYSKCWVLFWVLFWELFWGFFWDFHYDKTYLTKFENFIFECSVLTRLLRQCFRREDSL